MDTLFFYFSKILTLAVFPIPFIILLGVILVWKYGSYGKKKFLMLPFMILWIYSTNAFSQFIITPLEDEYPIVDGRDVPRESVVIVLGGMFNNLSRHPELPELVSSSDRLYAAINLYNRGVVNTILFTGGSGALGFNSVSEGDQARTFFTTMGVDSGQLIIESESRNTRENALYTKKLLEEFNLTDKPLVLVTSAFHMGRSVRSFQNLGLDVIPYPCDYRTLSSEISGFEDWVPNTGSLDTTNLAIKEWLGRPVYILYHYIDIWKSKGQEPII